MLFAFFERLVTIGSCHDSCQFSNLFREYGHIGQLTEIAHTIGFYPLVDLLLCFFESHGYSLFLVSMQMVTGPLFSNSTFMSAPNSPVPISLPKAFVNASQK